MPTQRDIARALGVNQATISLALRDDSSVSDTMKRRVRATAKRLGYRPNSFITALMSHIRSGRKVVDQGTIALLINRASEKEWLQNHICASYYKGVLHRSRELGFKVEAFVLHAPGMTAQRIDHILYTRGIRGVILAPPYRSVRDCALRWERYACVATGYAEEHQPFDRVANDHHQNVALAFRELTRLGYSRIGMCLPIPTYNNRRYRWTAGFLECQESLPRKLRIPLFAGSPADAPLEKFRKWYEGWRPDVLITVAGAEKKWLDALRLKVPKDVGLVCLAHPPESAFAGVEERSDCLGSTAFDLVAARIALNEYGPPSLPKLTLIEGRWLGGKSVRIDSSR
jgi:LacI family transcriptional regulator